VFGERDNENGPVCRVLSSSSTLVIEKLLFITSFHLWLKNFVVVSEEMNDVSGLIR
jgi:hypothetical protein